MPKQDDLGPVTARDMDHRRAADVEDVISKMSAQAFTANQRIVGIHGPQRAEGAVASFRAGNFQQADQLIVSGHVVDRAQSGQRIGAECRFVAGGLGQRHGGLAFVEIGQRFGRVEPHFGVAAREAVGQRADRFATDRF